MEYFKFSKIVRNSLCFVLSLFIFHFSSLNYVNAQTSPDWYMAGANPQRTSWVSTDISGVIGVKWYRPIEAFIDAKTQIVTGNGNIYVATTKGLIVLDAETGDFEWRFNTELPIGHTPTVIGNTVYVGGFDRKFYALDATNGRVVWTFTGAKAGYSVSPLVVNDTVFVGNRDGYFYAINSTNGNLRWQFPLSSQEPLGPILDSAAYSLTATAVFFASTNMRAYSLNATNGQSIWFHTENGQQVAGSEKISGISVQSYWPVVVGDKVIFSTSNVFTDGSPGYDSLPGVNNVKMENYRDYTFGSIAPPPPSPTPPAPTPTTAPSITRYSGNQITADSSNNTGWPNGSQLVDTQNNTQNPTTYSDGTPINYGHNPTSIENHFSERPEWRTTIALSVDNGTILTGSNNPPFVWSGTSDGNRHPPIVDPQNGVVYNSNAYQKSGSGISRQRIMGWLPGNQYLWQRFNHYAIDEPAILSGAGSDIMMNMCCDRIALVLTRSIPGSAFWEYGNMLEKKIPSLDSSGVYTPDIPFRYDPMWMLARHNLERLEGYYRGTSTSPNGLYSNHGLQNPLVAYRFTNSNNQIVQRVFTHKSNTIIALGETATPPRDSNPNPAYKTPILIETNNVNEASTLQETELIARLEKHIDATLRSHEEDPQDRFLNPAYYPNAKDQRQYFSSPAENLQVLSEAYQLLKDRNRNTALQTRLQTYLSEYFARYFTGGITGHTGWQGLSRDDVYYPEELIADMATKGASASGFEQRDVYGLWKYVEVFPSSNPTAQALALYDLVRNNVSTQIPPNTSIDTNAWNRRTPWEVNGYIASYYGLLNLLDTAGYNNNFCSTHANDSRCQKRAQVSTALNTLLAVKISDFQKDQPIYGAWDNPTGIVGMSGNFKVLNLSRNFVYMPKELAEYMRNNISGQLNSALAEYFYVGPFWFTGRLDNSKQERVVHPLYDYAYLFQAKAWISDASQSELSKYIDSPVFPRGDLYYIKNLITAIEASDTSSPIPGDTNNDNSVDGVDYVIWLNHYNQSVTPNNYTAGNFNSDNVVDGLDYVIWLANYSG